MQNASAEMRERLFTMRVSEEEAARFDRVAKHYGLNVAGVVRMLMKREDDSIGSTSVAARVRKRAADLAEDADRGDATKPKKR